MITNLITLLIIQLVLVYIVDLSGIMNSLKWVAWRILIGKAGIENSSRMELKPFTCSKCLSWWFGLAFVILIIPNLTVVTFILWVGYVALLSYLSTTSLNLLILIKDTLDSIILKLNDKVNK